MEEKKSKIDTCGGYKTVGGGGWYFRLAGISCKIGTIRTNAEVIYGNSSPAIKLDDRWIQSLCREKV